MGDVTLSFEQEWAASMIREASEVREGRVSVLDGPAGCGKTTVLGEVRRALGEKIRWVSPTGRGARRLRAEGCAATTMHRLLYHAKEDPDGGVTFTRKARHQLAKEMEDFRVLVVDEASMVGPDLWEDLRTVSREHRVPVVLVGDGEQLPPVQPQGAEPFSVFAESFLSAHVAEVVSLTKVFRQAPGTVLDVATRVRLAGGDWQEVRRALRELPSTEDPVGYALDAGPDTALVAHTNATRMKLNRAYRLKARSLDALDVIQDGEPLLVRRNHDAADVCNGDVVPCAWEGERGSTTYGMARLKVNGALCWVHEPSVRGYPPQGYEVPRDYARERVLRAELGYALTCHAAQGSEWRTVVVAVEGSLSCMEPDERRRWAYTAVTRARERAVLWWGR